MAQERSDTVLVETVPCAKFLARALRSGTAAAQLPRAHGGVLPTFAVCIAGNRGASGISRRVTSSQKGEFHANVMHVESRMPIYELPRSSEGSSVLAEAFAAARTAAVTRGSDSGFRRRTRAG